MKHSSLELVWIVVKDLNKAIEFYTREVGLHLKEKHEQFGWAELQGKGGARLGIAQENEKEHVRAGQNGVITFTVHNLAEAVRGVKGGKIVGDVLEIPGHAKMQMVRDTDGNHFQFVEMLS